MISGCVIEVKVNGMQKLEEEMKGKVVIITGGNKGIGSGCARGRSVFMEPMSSLRAGRSRRE